MNSPMPTPIDELQRVGHGAARSPRAARPRTSTSASTPSMHDARHRRPATGSPCAEHDVERDDGVDPEARRERERQVRDQPHRRGQRAPRRAPWRPRHAAERHLRRRQDRRVDEQDVAHREERAEPAEGLGAQRRAALGEAEAPVERARCRGWERRVAAMARVLPPCEEGTPSFATTSSRNRAPATGVAEPRPGRMPNRTARALTILAAATTAALPATADAKGVAALTVCGANGCHPVDRAAVRAGFETFRRAGAPRRAEPFFTIRARGARLGRRGRRGLLARLAPPRGPDPALRRAHVDPARSRAGRGAPPGRARAHAAPGRRARVGERRPARRPRRRDLRARARRGRRQRHPAKAPTARRRSRSSPPPSWPSPP